MSWVAVSGRRGLLGVGDDLEDLMSNGGANERG